MENYTFTQATVEEVSEIVKFSQENLQPEWRFCAGVAPYPNSDLMVGYIEAKHPFILARRSGELMGYQIASRGSGHPLWGMGHRDLPEHELLEGHAHITAHIWRHLGRVTGGLVPEDSDENVSKDLNSARERALEIYEEF